MSTVEYTRCDNPNCGNLAPDAPDETIYCGNLGWIRIIDKPNQYDLCPDCAKKALEAVGVER